MERTKLSLLLIALVLAAGCEGESPEAAALNRQLDAQHERVESLETERDDLRDLVERLDRRISRETAASDVAVEVPRGGPLSWRCNDKQRFSFTFRADAASVYVIQSIDGDVTRRMVHPGRTLRTPFVDHDAHLEWTITYRHKPATASTGVFVDPALKRGCYIRSVTLEHHARPN